MKKFLTRKRIVLIVGAFLVFLILGGFVAYTSYGKGPMYGDYTAADLISFADYSHADMSKVIPDELEIMRMIRRVGLPKTLDELSQDPAYQKIPACHAAAHAVGRAAFDLLGADAFSECTSMCFSGCIHGAFQRMSGRTESEGAMLETIRDLCNARATTFDETQCFHGSGHGLLFYTNYNLQKALDACRELGDSPKPGWCFGGVFMEYFGSGPPAALFESDAMPRDLHAPCDGVGSDPDTVRWCYHFQPDVFLHAYHSDYAKASAECAKAPEVARSDCFRRLGQLYSIDTSNSPTLTERFCGTVPAEYFSDCIVGSVRQFVDFFGENVGTRAVDFCKGLATGDAKQICYSEYAERMKDLFNDEALRTRLCADFEAPYNESCAASQKLPSSGTNDF